MAVLSIVAFPNEPIAFDITAQAGFVAAAYPGGDTFENVGRVGLYVRNTSGSTRTITIAAQRPCNHGFTHNSVISVPDGFEGFVATELENDRFNSPAGVVSLTYSAAGLNLAAVRLP